VDLVNYLEVKATNSNMNHYWIGEDKRYRFIERLGGGGMGNVYLAMDTRLGKPVALKLLKESLADDESIRVRFEWELAICAALKSQHIVQVSDYGVTPEGYPFYVMEYLEGQTLGQLLSETKKLSPQKVCQLVSQICAGLQIAHEGVMFSGARIDPSDCDLLSAQKCTRVKVVHRDLKPENIFLVPTALGDLVKIIDFGIAKIRHLHSTEHTNVTNFFLGTCHYASPEQIKGANNLDERSDIYSLGLIIYEMLSGFDPFGFNFRENRVSGEAWIVANSSTAPQPLRSQPDCEQLSPELEAVVMRCLQKSPKDRFSCVSELSQVLQAAVSYQLPVTSYQLPKVGSNDSPHTYHTPLSPLSSEGRSLSPPHPISPNRWLPLGIGAIALSMGLGLFGVPKLLNPPPANTSLKETVTTTRDFSVVKTLAGHSDTIWTVALSGDGQTLASGSEDKTIKLWNPKTGQLKKTLFGHTDAVKSIALSLDGHLLASGGTDRTIKLWNLKTEKLIRTLEGHQDTIWSVAISSDRVYLASASADRTIKIWNIHTKQLLHTLKGHSDWVFSVVFSPDGQTLASAGKDGQIKLWDVKTGRELFAFTGHQNAVRAVTFEPLGRYLASASWDGTIKIWDVQTKKELYTYSGHGDRLTSVVFNSDGKTLASSSIDGTVKLWDWENHTLLSTLAGHGDWVLSLVSDPSGATLISSSKDRTLKIWRR
jgi:eukaryotic-like serine/threonine-protein kinase